MKHLVAGLVFDSSLRENPWFVAFAVFVAFNTLVYLALTGSRMLWWFQPPAGGDIDPAHSPARANAPAIADVLPPTVVEPAAPGRPAPTVLDLPWEKYAAAQREAIAQGVPVERIEAALEEVRQAQAQAPASRSAG